MSRPEIKVSKRCSKCGATLSRKARFCRQCGTEYTRDGDTKPLDLNTVKIEELQTDDKEFVNREGETGDTVALNAQQIISTDEDEEDVTENNAAIETQSNDAASVWAIEKDETENEAVAWTENSPTVALSSETIALTEPTEKAEYQTETLSEDVDEEAPKDEMLEVESENSDVVNRIKPVESSYLLLEEPGRSRSRVKRIVAKSNRALDQSSSDPGLRFAVISVVVFLLALALFMFSRYLK